MCGVAVSPGLVRRLIMPSIGSGNGSYVENGDGYLEMVGSHQFELDEESDCINAQSESSGKMEDRVEFRGGGRRGLSPSSLEALDGVIEQALENVRAAGYGETVCAEFRQHFARLPSRYVFCFLCSFDCSLHF